MKTKTIAFTLACASLKVKIVIWMKRFKKEKKKKDIEQTKNKGQAV